MYAAAFHAWLAKAEELTSVQRQQAIEGLRQAPRSGPDPLATVLDAGRACPHCHHAVCRPWGQAHGLPRMRCAACGKTFNALTGTPLARLRHRERWGEYAQALIDGETVRAAPRRCGVHKNTAFRWRHRFLTLPAEVKPSHLRGIVEADETYFLESHQGERHLSRPSRQRGGAATKRGLSDEQIPVLVVRDRNASTTDAVLPKANTAAVTAILGPIMDPDAVLCSDSAAIYRSFAKAAHIAHIAHTAVNFSAGIRVIDHALHIQNVNAYHGRHKGWMAGFHGVGTKYLPNYLGWRRFLERFSSSLAPSLVLDLAITGGQHLTQI